MKNERKTIFYIDENNDDFAGNEVVAKKIDKNYKYIHKNLIWKLIETLVYRVIAVPIAFIYAKIKFRFKIIGKEKLKQMKNDGYFIYINHTQPILDTFIPSFVALPKKSHIVAHPDNVSIPVIGKFTQMLGAIPIPGDIASGKKFLEAVKEFTTKKRVIAIYPEAHVWPYYTKIRNFSAESFKYPVKLDKQVFSITTTYQLDEKKASAHKNIRPKVIIYVDGPFFSNNNLNYKEQQKQLRNKVYESMVNNSKKSNMEYIKYEKKEM